MLDLKFGKNLLLFVLTTALLSVSCGFVDPIREQIAGIGAGSSGPSILDEAVAEGVTRTPRPTFTPTTEATATPTITLTPTPPPTPTSTFTPVPPTDTPVPENTPTPVPTDTPPPTNTPRPQAPTATFTPAPPTATPTPSFPYKIIEGPVSFPSTNSWLSIYIALTDGNNTPIGGLKVVGDHQPSGTHWESELSCFDFCKVSGIQGSIKAGNVTFEPPLYETGVWNLHVVDGGGAQVSQVIPVSVDFDNRAWYFIILRK